MSRINDKPEPTVTLFLCGDVMTGRGIDQVLSHPGDPSLHEPAVRSAAEYVLLAEDANGPIPRPIEDSYVWGEVLGELQRVAPDLVLINLETALTTSDDYDRGKCIHYRMHPANVGCLTSAGIQCCALANNHVLDWGQGGLLETLDTLARAGLATAGAGATSMKPRIPAVFEAHGGRRILVFACGCESAGVPPDWAATASSPGVWHIDENSPESVTNLASTVLGARQPGDIVVLSIHWGSNWGYGIPSAQRELAHGLIDCAAVDIIHGHSSHHVKGLEVYRGRPILYGCGDFLTDYEGIPGREEFRDDLGLMYFVTIDRATGGLAQSRNGSHRLKHFRLNRPAPVDIDWLADTLNREGRRLGTFVAPLRTTA